jgi:hypothetical protein
MGFRSELWTVRPLDLPRAWRHCASCKRATAFRCSEKFRVNANKKQLDVWLIYRCCVCDSTWNFPVISRRNVTSMAAPQLDAFLCNDPLSAWQHGFDIVNLRRFAMRLEYTERIAVDRQPQTSPAGIAAVGDSIRINAPVPCDLRLDRLLGRELNLSRDSLRSRYRARQIIVAPDHREALRRSMHNDQQIVFVGGIMRNLA